MFKSASALVCLAVSFAAQAAWVQQFTPQELVDRQTRATAVFSADMLPLGRSKAPAPFRVSCGKVRGSGQWVDTKTWAWQLERALQPGERCVFTLRSGLKAANGESISGQNRYQFFAPGPWPRAVYPSPGERIEEDQAFVITPAGPLKPASVEQHVWCEADGVGNRIPVRLVPPAQRAAILKAMRRGGDGDVVVSCSERLPAGAKMKLIWGKGVEAENGSKSTRQESFLFPVREPFRATVSCARERASAPCSPLSSLTLEFSTAVDTSLRDKVKLVTPDGVRLPIDPTRRDDRRENTAQSFVFAPPFAPNAELRVELPADFTDESGRLLTNAASFPLRVATGALPPLAKFPGDFGIIELKEGGVLPVTLRNVEARLGMKERRLTKDAEVISTMQALARFNRQTKTVKRMRDGKLEEFEDSYYARELSFLAGQPGVTRRELPKPGGSGEFEVLGIPLTKPGYHVVEIESLMLGAALLGGDKSVPRPMYVRSAALVTNMAVHFKRGVDNALVWVTALDSGKPVAGAEVRVSDCKGTLLWSAKTDAEGRALAERTLAEKNCEGEDFLFISARLGEDYSFVRNDWAEGIEPWRFGIPTWGESQGTRLIHTLFDRSLLRPGQTVSMKHIARDRGSRGMSFPTVAALPAQATIRHDNGDEYKLPLSWDAQGVALSQWKIPLGAKRGHYSVRNPRRRRCRFPRFRFPPAGVHRQRARRRGAPGRAKKSRPGAGPGLSQRRRGEGASGAGFGHPAPDLVERLKLGGVRRLSLRCRFQRSRDRVLRHRQRSRTGAPDPEQERAGAGQRRRRQARPDAGRKAARSGRNLRRDELQRSQRRDSDHPRQRAGLALRGGAGDAHSGMGDGRQQDGHRCRGA